MSAVPVDDRALSHANDGTLRLGDLKIVSGGFIEMVRCDGCGHLAPLPLTQLLRRFGGAEPVARAMFAVRCGACGLRKPARKRMRLCDPGCARQHG